MSATVNAVRCGLVGGWIELRQAFSGANLVGQLFWPVLTLAALVFLRHRQVGADGLTLGPVILPGLLGMFVAFGLMLTVQYLPADREDGTLLRAKATPHGVSGYLVAKLLMATASVLVYLVVVAVPGWFLVSGLRLGDVSWTRLGWVLVLGLVATQLLGAALGALLPSSRASGYVALAGSRPHRHLGHLLPDHRSPGLAADPRAALPALLAGTGYALGSAARQRGRARDRPAPGGSQKPRPFWAGGQSPVLVIAPLVLRRMARRESGTRLAEPQPESLPPAA